VVDVAGRIISKVAAREGAIIPLRLVEHGDMRRDAFILDQPVQHRSCPVSGIPDKPLWLEAEALLCSLDHGLRRADLGLANGAGCLDVNDDAELHVDEKKPAGVNRRALRRFVLFRRTVRQAVPMVRRPQIRSSDRERG